MIAGRKFDKLVSEELKKEGFIRKRDCTIRIAHLFVRCYHRALLRALVEYGGVQIRNWGVCEMKLVPSRKINNPKMGKVYVSEEMETPTFKFNKRMARRLNMYQDCDLLDLNDVVGDY